MELIGEYRAVIATIAAVAGLLVLILRFRMNAFAALILVATLAALAAGMAPGEAFDTVIAGMGGTLGFIAVVIGLGALFGAIIEASGGVQSLAAQLLPGAGIGRGRWTMSALGLLASIPVFFDVALIILAPLVFAMAERAKRPALAFGLPLLAGLATAHAFIPPTPGPIAVAEILGADLGWVIGCGMAVGVLAVALAGPVYTAWLDKRGALPVGVPADPLPADGRPAAGEVRAGAGLTAGLILLPLVLILAGTMARSVLAAGPVRAGFELVGHPFAALLIACGATLWLLPAQSPEQKSRLGDALGRALEPAGAVILVTGAGGAFKQVLVDTGAGAQLADAALGLGMTPLVAGYVIALLVRVAQGSATVAMITAAGLTAPLAGAAGLGAADLALVVIAVAAGATGLSHVNDSGFWLVNRIFGLSEGDTLRTWSVAATIVSLAGFAGSLVLSLLV
jgi:gluconate transporter